MPSHGSIRFCSTPEGVLYPKSVADGVVGGDSVSHRSDAVAILSDGIKAGDAQSYRIPGTGIPWGWWGARNDRTHYAGGQSDMEAVANIHGATWMQSSVSRSNPNALVARLDEAAALGMSISSQVTEGYPHYGNQIPGEWDIEKFKTDLNNYWAIAQSTGADVALLNHISNGTWLMYALGDDLSHAATQATFGDWEEMATAVKTVISPLLCTWFRANIGQIASGEYQVLDHGMPQVRTNDNSTQQEVIDYTDNNLTQWEARNLYSISFSINVETCPRIQENPGRIVGPIGLNNCNGRTMVEPSDLAITWDYWAAQPEIGLLSSWEYDSSNIIPTMPPDGSACSFPSQDVSPNPNMAAWWDGGTGSTRNNGLPAAIASVKAACAAHVAVPLTRP